MGLGSFSWVLGWDRFFFFLNNLSKKNIKVKGRSAGDFSTMLNENEMNRLPQFGCIS